MKSVFLIILGIAGFGGGICLQYYRQSYETLTPPKLVAEILTLEGKIVSVDYPNHMMTLTSVDRYTASSSTYLVAFNDMTSIFNETAASSSLSEQLLNSLKNKQLKIYFSPNDTKFIASNIVVPVAVN